VALTADQTAYLDSKLGPDTWESADLEAAISRIAARTGADVTAATGYAARETLEGRLATMLAEPASETIPGEYSRSNDANIRALREAIDGISAPSDSGDAGNPIRVIAPDRTRWAR
jgi:hypothetical protein